MDRRKVLLVVAALIAAMGTLLVFLYVRGADDRAGQKFDAVQVLQVTKPIAVGETVAAAQAAGKFKLGSVGAGEKLGDALDSLAPIEGMFAQTAMFPGEQVIQSKFASTVASGSNLTIPKGSIAMSVQLTDTARVAGFVNPGDHVAIFITNSAFSRVLLPDVEVIAVGTTTVVPTTTTDQTGAQTTEQLPRTLFTLGVPQQQAEKIMYATSAASGGGELSFGLLNKDSIVKMTTGANSANLFK